MNIGRILSRAWRITWRHKVLWIFGIASALFAGASGVPSPPRVQYTMNQSDLDMFGRYLPWSFRAPGPMVDPRFWNWGAILGGAIAVGLILFLVAILIAIVSAIVRYTSTGALVKMVDEVEETGETGFKAGLAAGWKGLLKLFAIDLLVGLMGMVLALVLSVIAVLGIVFAIGPAVALANAGAVRVVAVIWAVLASLGVVALLILLALAISAPITIVRELAYRYSVLEGATVFDAIGRAYRLMRSRPRASLLVWLLMVGISLVLGLLLVPPTMVMMMAAMAGVWALLQLVTSQAILALVIATPIMLLVVLLVALVSGVFVTFGSAVWTLAYRELTVPESD